MYTHVRHTFSSKRDQTPVLRINLPHSYSPRRYNTPCGGEGEIAKGEISIRRSIQFAALGFSYLFSGFADAAATQQIRYDPSGLCYILALYQRSFIIRSIQDWRENVFWIVSNEKIVEYLNYNISNRLNNVTNVYSGLGARHRLNAYWCNTHTFDFLISQYELIIYLT